MENIPNWFVVCMGLGTVFVGLICIVILCKIMGLICRKRVSDIKNEPPKNLSEGIENRQEIIAAVVAAVAENMGKDVSALRVLSFKKI